MKSLLPAVSLCLGLAGCYTMIYPPLDETARVADTGGQVVTLPDSLAGKSVIIVNQNQVIVDRYYQDPYYQRGGLFGGSGYWDPYYYNPRGYYQDNRWRHGWYQPDYSPGSPSPQPKKSRRDKDYRSEVPPADSPNPTGTSGVTAASPVSSPILADASPPVPTESGAAAKSQPATQPGDSGRSLRSVQPPDSSNPQKQSAPAADQPDDNKSRRGNARER